MNLFGTLTILRLFVSALLLTVGVFTRLDENIDIALYLAAYVIVGYPVFINFLRAIYNRQPFDENLLMTVASIGAFIIGEHHEGIILLLFYQVGKLFEEYAVDRSRRSISSLVDLLPEEVSLIVDGKIIGSAPEDVRIGDVIVVRPGERIPLDGTIIEGSSMIDTSSITGESIPKRASIGDAVLSGCISTNGVLTISVGSLYSDSTASRIIGMIEDAYDAKSKSENFVTKFARYYTPLVVTAAILLAILPPIILNSSFDEWVYRALTFLVISCPCALVISIPLAFFGGIGGASRIGVLVKGGNYLEALAGADTVVFDKTGTLTEGTFEVEKIFPIDIEAKELLKIAAYAEFHSNHPIAMSIKESYGNDIDGSKIGVTEETAGKGVAAEVDGSRVLIGNRAFMSDNNIEYIQPDDFGTIIHIGIDGKYKGYLMIYDRIRKDSRTAVSMLKEAGIKHIIMLTGDIEYVGRHVADQLGIQAVYTDLRPGDKIDIVENLTLEGRKIAFVGDGINDAPALARSDIGIAMGAMGSDAAIEAADIVIMDDMPSKVPLAIKIAKKTRSIAVGNIIFALGIKAIFLILGALGYVTMIEAVFADVGVSVIAILNSIRTLRTSDVRSQKRSSTMTSYEHF